jgi:hypothetical protein
MLIQEYKPSLKEIIEDFSNDIGLAMNWCDIEVKENAIRKGDEYFQSEHYKFWSKLKTELNETERTSI